jgi:hypothetical protein
MLCSDFSCSNCIGEELLCYPNEAACPTCPPPSPPPSPQQCLVCDKNQGNKNKPTSLTFKYTAGQGVNSNNQGSKAYGALTSTFPTSASVSVAYMPSVAVTDGQTFTVVGSFGADTQVSISGQTINFHTSCSVELKTGDQFGPLTVIGSNNCASIEPCGAFGCCPEGNPKDDAQGSNCCSFDQLPECTLCCPDGSPQPCCGAMPTITEQSSELVINKDEACTGGNLPFLAKGAIQLWLADNGGAVCQLNNAGPDIDSDAMPEWTADVEFLEIEATICQADSGCPSIPVKFTCCDPCSAGMLCVSSYASLKVTDTGMPIIHGVESTEIECTGNDLTAVHSWVEQATCTDMEGTANLLQTSVPDLSGPSCARQASVTFACSDDCGNVVTDIATITIVDTTAPNVAVEPTDMTVSCDGEGNEHDVQLWLNFHGGMFVHDTCSGGCSSACSGGCSYNSNFGNLNGDNEQATETTCAAITWMHTEPAFTAFQEGDGTCGQVASVTFSATDGCGNSVSRTAKFFIIKEEGPQVTTPAQNSVNPYLSSSESQLAFYEWILNTGGAVFDDGCGDLTYSMTPSHPVLPDDACAAESTVMFTATDECGRTTSSTGTFFVEDNSPPVIDPICSQSLEYGCDKTCPGYSDAVWESTARNALTDWVADFACSCATDCSNVILDVAGVPESGSLCGLSGVVTVTATDEDDLTDTIEVPYNFPLTEAVPPPPPPPVIPPSGCVICSRSNKNRPSSLTFKYIAGQGVNSNNQGNKAYGALTGTFPSTASVSFEGMASVSVTDGMTFTVSGSFSADTEVSISGQEIHFHTSCSVELSTGDRYGPLLVVQGGSCPAYVTCGSSYGCCPDDPDMPCLNAGCDNCNTCGDFGCCIGTSTPKIDFSGSNCPESCDMPQVCTRPVLTCEASLFGCCPDSDISQADAEGSNCPCSSSEFGCCGQSQIVAIDAGGSNCPCWTSEFGCCPMTTPGSELMAKIDEDGSNCPPMPCEPSPAPGCVICDRSNKNRPSSMTFQYNAGFQYDATALISMPGFSGTISDGQVFTVSGTFGTWTYIDIEDKPQVQIHTSCSVSLAAGDVYGPFTILGGSGCPYVPCDDAAPQVQPGIVQPGIMLPPATPPPPSPPATKQIICLACGSIVLHSCSASNSACVNYGGACPSANCNGKDESGTSSPGAPSGVVAGPGCSIGTDACDAKKAKITAITFEYIGDDKEQLIGNFRKPNAGWNHGQSGFRKIKVAGDLPSRKQHPLKTMGKLKYDLSGELVKGRFLKTNADGTGTVFTLRASDIGKKFLPGTLKMKVRGLAISLSGGTCKYPLRIGDEFGPLRVVGFETTKSQQCAWDPARVSSLLENAPDASSGDDTGTPTSSATVALGIVGAIVVILAAVGAIVYVRRGDQQAALQPGAFEVDLDSRQIRRIAPF